VSPAGAVVSGSGPAMKLSAAQLRTLRVMRDFEAKYPKSLGCVEGTDVHTATADALVRRGLATRTSQKVYRSTRHRDSFGSSFYWSSRDVLVFYVWLTDAGRAALAAGTAKRG